MSTVIINSDELNDLMSLVEIDCRLLKEALDELTANVCSCVVETVLAVDVGFDWRINEAKLVCVRMGAADDVSLSDRMVDADDLMYTELDGHVISIDDMYID